MELLTFVTFLNDINIIYTDRWNVFCIIVGTGILVVHLQDYPPEEILLLHLWMVNIDCYMLQNHSCHSNLNTRTVARWSFVGLVSTRCVKNKCKSYKIEEIIFKVISWTTFIWKVYVNNQLFSSRNINYEMNLLMLNSHDLNR